MTLPIQNQNLIALLGIESLSDEQKIDLIDRVSEVVQKRLLLRILDFLPEEKKTEFDQVVASQDDNALYGFLAKEVPNYEVWFEEEVANIKQELAQRAQNLEE